MAQLSEASDEVRIFDGVPELMRATAEEIVLAARNAVDARGRFTWALAGGSTPRTVYELLASDFYRARMPWSAIHFFWGDERHVPPDHADSNFRMVNESLLSKIAIPTANVFRVRAELADAAEAAQEYESSLKTFFKTAPGEFPNFDLIFLGLGTEGHTASLFPDSKGLTETSRIFIANWVEKFKTDRLTLTFPAINHATDVMFLASGPDKADILHQVLEEENTPSLPAQRVQPQSRVMWMLDAAAAAKITV